VISFAAHHATQARPLRKTAVLQIRSASNARRGVMLHNHCVGIGWAAFSIAVYRRKLRRAGNHANTFAPARFGHPADFRRAVFFDTRALGSDQ